MRDVSPLEAEGITMNLKHGYLGVPAILFALVCTAASPYAEHQKTVSGIIVNIGVVPAEQALRSPGEATTHGKSRPSGAQHLVVTLSDAAAGSHIADAQVTVEIKDPRGNVEKKKLLPASTAGMPDYSETFRFGYSGKYTIRVVAALKGRKKPLNANFTWTHVM